MLQSLNEFTVAEPPFVSAALQW